MCGIGAILALKPLDYPTTDLALHISSKIRHRGPDDEGYVAFQADGMVSLHRGQDTHPDSAAVHKLTPLTSAGNPQIILAHRRLSIIDHTPSGFQPMSSEDGRYWMVYNGEIYNYKELRKELEENYNCQFKTRTDSEVVLKSFQIFGEKCVNRFDGMWAFLIYDNQERRLFASRDRFGVKPLYYIYKEKYLAIASEIKALVDLPVFQKHINRRAAFDYLVLGHLEREPNGLFDQILELPPSSCMFYDFKDKLLKVWHYYSIAYKPELGEYSEEKLQGYNKKIRRLISNAVSSHLMAEVPIALSLSGGLDSSTLAVLVQRELESGKHPQLGTKQKLFTVCFPGSKADESSWAKIVAEHVNADWVQVKPTSEGFIDSLEKVSYTQDLPFLGMNGYSHFAMMDAMKQHGVKVTMDGQGADELFGGYPSHYVTYMRDLMSHGHLMSFGLNLISANNSFADRFMVMREEVKRRLFLYRKKATGKGMYRKDDTLEYGYLRKEFWERYNRKLTDINIPGVLNAHLFMDYTGPTMKSLLRATDRNAMAFGIESRTPFADDLKLAEEVFKINGIYKIRYGMGKNLLRGAVGDLLPKKVLYRRDKMGFTTPQDQWFKENSAALHDYIGDQIKDVLDPKAISKDWKKLSQNPNPRLWRIVSFAVWRKVYGI